MLMVNNLVGFGTGSSGPRGPFPVGAAAFDGSTGLTKSGSFTGVSDGPNALISFWLLKSVSNSMRIFDTDNGPINPVRITTETNGKITLTVRGAPDGVNKSVFWQSTNGFATGVWQHFAISWNTNFSAGNKVVKLAVDGVAEAMPPLADGDPAFNPDYTPNNYSVSGTGGSAPFINGALAEFYFNFATYLDITQASNNQKFRDVNGFPVDLGATGSTPTGTAPGLFLRVAAGAAASTFATNVTGNGNMTVAAGALTLSSTSPSD